MMLFFGGKETPFAGAQRCFLPPEPPILPQTRFIQKNRQRRSAAAFPATHVPRQKKLTLSPCIRKISPIYKKENPRKNSGGRLNNGCRACHDTRTAT